MIANGNRNNKHYTDIRLNVMRIAYLLPFYYYMDRSIPYGL